MSSSDQRTRSLGRRGDDRSQPIEIVHYTIYHSPNAYLGSILAARRLDRLPARIERRPIFVPRARGVKIADLVGSVETPTRTAYHREDCARWAARLGVELALLPPGEFEARARRWARSPWEREELPARAYYAAVGTGCEARFDDALFRAAWVEGRDVNDESVVRAAARAAGLDADDLLERARAEDTRRRLDASLAAFEADGCPGVPTWVVNGERFWGKDRVDLLAARIEELARGDASAATEPGDDAAAGSSAVAPEVRSFVDGDREQVIDLWREAFPDDPPRNDPAIALDRKLARDPELLLVAELAGSIVGAVIVGYDGGRGWIYHLAVRATARRRGIGRSLLAASEQRLRALGCPKVNLQVVRRNEGVVEFYRRSGYAIEDRVSMGKLL